ncbi:MAG TPA: hypothetical protein VNF04_18480, partial [Stellaceae bacterium]|nr:hypothetical protein [Stellaceae bacterium]
RIVMLASWEVPQSLRFDLSHPHQDRDHPTAHRAAVNPPLPGLLPLLPSGEGNATVRTSFQTDA